MRYEESLGDVLRSMISTPTFARGVGYAETGRVHDLRSHRGAIQATVRGTDDYTVTIAADGQDCDCPHAMDGNLCKHVVAVAIVAGLLDDATEPADDDALSSYLHSLSHDQLVELLIDAANESTAVEKQLRLAAGEARADVALLTVEVDRVLGTRRFLDYRDALDYAHQALDVVAALDRAAATPAARDVVPVVERAIKHVVRVILEADDSDGAIGDIARSLLDLHAAACRRGHPDPVKLARWLARFAFEDQDVFEIDVRDYVEALGDRGLATYRSEVRRRTELAPDAFAARYAAQRLALLDRDADAIVRLFGADLAGPYRFAQVAGAMVEIERYDDALAWARRGMDRPPTWQSRELFDLAAGILARRGAHDEALDVRRRGLTALPDLLSYQALRHAAEQVDGWAAARPWALAELAQRAPHAHIEALLDDGDVDAAWTAAHADGTSTLVSERLATRRAKTHPADAIPHYRRYVEGALRPANRNAYRAAARWLLALKDVHDRAGTSDEFDAYLAALRETHRRRPAFLDELRHARL